MTPRGFFCCDTTRVFVGRTMATAVDPMSSIVNRVLESPKLSQPKTHTFVLCVAATILKRTPHITLEDVYDFLMDVARRVKIGGEGMLIALVYLSRVDVRREILEDSWRPCVMIALLLAQKVWIRGRAHIHTRTRTLTHTHCRWPKRFGLTRTRAREAALSLGSCRSCPRSTRHTPLSRRLSSTQT